MSVLLAVLWHGKQNGQVTNLSVEKAYTVLTEYYSITSVCSTEGAV